MKKIVIILLLVCILFNFKTNEVKLVFNDYSSDLETSYSMYVLSFPNKNISTENFFNYFINTKVIWIKPYLTNSLKVSFSNYVYNFEMNTVKSDINRFKKTFIEKLEKNNYRKEALNYKVEGIKIEEMMIYCNNKDIELISKIIENVDIIKSD